MLAPVALFVYNRLEHTKQTIEALRQNRLAAQTPLVLFSDGPKAEQDAEPITAIRKYLRTVAGFYSIDVFPQEGNRGLATSIISGVTQVCRDYGRVIVIEDDIETAPSFLSFMNDALARYEQYATVWSVSGYTPPIQFRGAIDDGVYFHYRASSWGWGTWKDRWEKATWTDYDFTPAIENPEVCRLFARGGNDLPEMLRRYLRGQSHSWLIRWCYWATMHGGLTAYPRYSQVSNIGIDGSGTNFVATAQKYLSRYATNLALAQSTHAYSLPVYADPNFHRAMHDFWSGDMLQRLRVMLSRMLRRR